MNTPIAIAGPNGLIIVVVLFALLWLLLIRPQRRRQLQQTQLVKSVTVGAEIVTAGGLYGTVVEAHEDELRVEIAPGTVVRIARRAVAGVIPPEEPEADETGEENPS